MISAVCTQVVEDFGEDSLSAVNDFSGAHNIRPWTVLVEQRARYFGIKQYTAFEFKIADVVRGHIEGFEKIAIQSEHLTKSYSRVREVALGSTMALEIFKLFPDLKAQAYASGKISMNIKTGGLTMKKIDELEFQKSLRKQAIDRDHSFFKFLKQEKRLDLHVINLVLETDDETVIEFTCKYDGTDDFSTKVAGQTGSDSADISNSKAETITLPAGTVLACRWQQLDFDKSTWLIRLTWYNFERPAKISSEENENMVRFGDCYASSEEENEDDEDERDQDARLFDLYDATEEEIRKFKAAVGIVMRSASDCNALLNLLDDDGGKAKQFTSQLQNSDAVWTLLGLMGYQIQKNRIKQTTRGPFYLLVPTVLEASILLDNEDLELVGKCNDYQKTELLRIIKAIDGNKRSITVDTKFLHELQNEPVETIVALIDVKIDFKTGKVMLPHFTDILNGPIKYLLHSL